MYTYQEITEQAEKLQETLDLLSTQTFELQDVDHTYFVGCGTSYYLAISAAKYFQKGTGQIATPLPASEIFTNTDIYFHPKQTYQVVVISRSGTTSEAVKALKVVQSITNVQTLSVTCYGNSPLAKIADHAIILENIKEKSVVMTQSFTNMLYALQLYTAKCLSNQEDWQELELIPKLVKELLKGQEAIKEVGAQLDYERFIYLGAAYNNGLAKELTLKLKEMTQTECESYSNLEFRHGPISIVNEKTVAIVMTQKQTIQLDQDLVKDIQKLGGKVVVLGPVPEHFQADYLFPLGEELADHNRLILYVPLLQYLAYHRAVQLGFNPDEPKNLTQVVQLNL